jgi:hypothetical protein
MKEFTAHQIADALAGNPGSPWPELRLLMLFQSEAPDRIEAELESFGDDLRKAA